MKVSILINNYNYGQYLEYCLQSVLNQTYDNIEIIVFDDNSKDNSIDILKKYSETNEIIQVIFNSDKDKESHPAFCQANAINKAFSQSKGEIICLLDSDDAFLPSKVGRIVELFSKKSFSETVLIQHPFEEINFNNEKTENVRPTLLEVNNIKTHIIEQRSQFYLFTQTSGLCFRRSYLEKVLPILPDQSFLIWPDVRLTRTSIFYGEVFTITEPLGQYRIHDCNDSLKLKNQEYLSLFFEQLYKYTNDIFMSFDEDEISFIKPVEDISKFKRIQNLNMQLKPFFTKVAIFGASVSGLECYDHVRSIGINVEMFIDNSLQNQKKMLKGKSVVSVNQFMSLSDTIDAVIVCSLQFNYQMRKQLLDEGYFGTIIEF